MPQYQMLPPSPGGTDGDESSPPRTGKGVPIMKLLLIGDAFSGKSCLLRRWHGDEYHDEAYEPTLGLDFKVKNVQVRKQWSRLQVWDTSGQDSFRAITKSYYRGAHGLIVAYAIGDRRSFDSASQWIEEFTALAEDGTPILLLGMKCDLEGQREVAASEGEELGRRYGCGFKEVSAKTGLNVSDAFVDLASRMLQVHKERSETHRRRSRSMRSEASSVPDFDLLLPRQKKSLSCCAIM
ncbi:small rab-related GTPase [Chloropicon primus]|uniref:Small rab-related GTPase n=1 Tax=Chloropicon primus TaxID=1764295 RepID=A0A5B8MYQ0_9CHLO|nr:small rab-related GTPase [Chloropicon primus]UPR03732.1 small rab-related GTPase [Chloropicon primus]|mmetsp:Transcript_14423/g.41027  ORF Transcript_14423/g.41027 Transcript_14423/m.41027 type:complete len:238 (+) Transcript_14423:141-854(+)|eukprot:QDZ24524.1 small rab-related GTPase [Chloropicon primus]